LGVLWVRSFPDICLLKCIEFAETRCMATHGQDHVHIGSAACDCVLGVPLQV
jgi:hypothetical protein